MIRCPRDGALLKHEKISSHGLHSCPKCRGLWVNRNVLADVLKKALPKGQKVHSMESQYRGSVTCPVDKKKMSIVLYNKVEIDACSSCGGFWLDMEELKKLYESLHRPPKEVHLVFQIGEFIADSTPDQFDVICEELSEGVRRRWWRWL